jgi:Uma2 family endonuclease
MVTETLPVRRKIDVDTYHRMGETGLLGADERVELVDGDIVEMVPIGSEHAGTTGGLIRRLTLRLGETAFVTGASPLHIDRFNEPQPDVLVLRPRADDYRRAHPGPADVLWLIEVAQSSLAYDRGFKSRLYARAGVPELWIVDLAGRAIELHRRPTAEGYASVERRRTGELRPEALPAVALDVAAVLETPSGST